MQNCSSLFLLEFSIPGKTYLLIFFFMILFLVEFLVGMLTFVLVLKMYIKTFFLMEQFFIEYDNDNKILQLCMYV